MSLLVKVLTRAFSRLWRGSGSKTTGADVPGLLARARALSSARRYGDAEALYRKALDVDPGNRDALLGLGIVNAQEGRHEHARGALEKLVGLYPDCLDGLNALANVARLQGRWQRACEYYGKALALVPDSVAVLTNFGTCLRDMGEIVPARAHLARALELEPHNPEVLLNFATVLIDAGDSEGAVSCLRRVLELRPEMAEAHTALGHVLLLRGEFAEAWREYDWRHRADIAEPQREYPYPQWQGEAAADDLVLVRAEQGLGDQIMFASCVPDLIARARGVILECDQRLAPMFARSFPKARVDSRRDDNPKRWREAGCVPDKQVFMGSLPRYFRKQWNDFPARSAYLAADPARVDRWRVRLEQLGTGLKVGISWRGGTVKTRQTLRSIPLTQWRPIFAGGGCQWISVQYGEAAAEAPVFANAEGVPLYHWAEAIDDYEETAALIAALDLVISVQTAAVHLAGALGRPAWVMVPAAPEWRYLAQGERLPWYPSVTVLRQQSDGQWGPVLADVRTRLDALTRA